MQPHTLPQRLNPYCRIALLLRLVRASFLLPLPLHLDLYEPLVIAMRAGFGSVVFDFHDYFRTGAAVLEDVGGEVAWGFGGCGFGDCVAACAD